MLARAAGAARRELSTAASKGKDRIVLVDGVRTPFHPSGTLFNNYIAQDLGRFAIKGLLARTGINPAELDYVTYGNVIQEVRTSNIARESALGAGIPDTVPAHTVSMACISANQAITTGAAYIHAGQAEMVVAGGAETMSDVPIRWSRPVRQRMLASRKARKPADFLKLLKGLKLADLAPEAPAIAEFSTGEVMGHSSDRMAARFGVTRAEQDEFALRSHHNAAKATADGILKEEIMPVDGVQEDTGVRGDSTLAKLNSLKPAFVRPHGTHTAANSSFLTDGASAVLLMKESRAKAMGFTPLAAIKDFIYVSQDPSEELLLGPAYAIAKLMKRCGLGANEIGVWELHEAFAGQVLSNLRALESDSFAADKAKTGKKVGSVDMDKINAHGGSLSIGHPFGATGGRIITTTANRMNRENSEFGILAACAAGGQGHAMILERV
ncbi:hypothetical protein FNF27_00156 [Cafeteria roenbergensis]|uniref:acetyl-CoA C-acyltransferase n=1 Tax=Cafeteria roenbergensis TaxID=33653 RepID=A0A5A8EK88_CAFRO|nr:hypothetical protein FNF27_00156 [Cafeteria roenbergensis]CAE7315076.1 HADHB [Symbiodinium sp. KB8]